MSHGKNDDLSEADGKNSERHSDGRWKKGHCPNPQGRGRAIAKKELELVRSVQEHSSDIHAFARGVVPMKVGGETVHMTREASLLHKRYESAMKGSVTAQRDLIRDIEKNAEMIARAVKRYDDLVLYWHHECFKAHGSDFEMPLHAELEMAQLLRLLSEIYPESYKKP